MCGFGERYAKNKLDWNKYKWVHLKDNKRKEDTDRQSIEMEMVDDRAHADAWWRITQFNNKRSLEHDQERDTSAK